VSHELNNMLAVILGLNELVSRRLGDSHQAQSDLQEVRRAAEHCGRPNPRPISVRTPAAF
jgi:signal transduction histidine kinase